MLMHLHYELNCYGIMKNMFVLSVMHSYAKNEYLISFKKYV